MRGIPTVAAGLCGVLAGPVALPAARTVEADRDELKLQVIDGRPVVTGVFVEGTGPYTFLLDTGAQSNAIDEKSAARLGWKPRFALTVVTAGGEVEQKAHIASSVTLAGAYARDQEFLIGRLDAVRQLSPVIEGVLGQAFLRNFDYLLDLRRKRLTVHHPPVEGRKVPFQMSNGRMIVSTSRGALVVDSGANTSVLREDAVRDAFTREALMHTIAGSRVVKTGEVTLRIGARDYRNVPAILAYPAKQDRSDPDGVLPIGLLGSIYVCNSGGYVVIDPRMPR